MGQRTRATAAAVGLALLGGGLAGCSGSGEAAERAREVSTATPATAVRRSADVLIRAGSSMVVTSMEMASGGTKLSITGTGGYDFARHRGRLKVVLPVDAAGDHEHKPVTELMTPGALYMKNRGEGVPADKWVRVDTTRLSDGNLVTGGATEPLVAAELLRAARKVTYVGEETADGVWVRHYRGVTDIERAAESASPASRGPLRAAAKAFSVTRVPFDAYLDEEGRLRKTRQRFTFINGAEVVSTMWLYAFGSPVRVVLPDEGDIYTGKIVSSPEP